MLQALILLTPAFSPRASVLCNSRQLCMNAPASSGESNLLELHFHEFHCDFAGDSGVGELLVQ